MGTEWLFTHPVRRVCVLCLLMLVTLSILTVFYPVQKAMVQNLMSALEEKRPHMKPVNPNVTVVTAYFNLGKFQKGPLSSHSFDTMLYEKWARVYRYLMNPFIIYTDSHRTANLFRKLRSNATDFTKIIHVSRKDLWAFNYMDQIRKIYSIPEYPEYHPNTVVPEYSCAQHSKYAVVSNAIKHNYFNTKFFTWIDLGYFRDISAKKRKFIIVKPHKFNESRVTMNKVYPGITDMSVSVDSIFKGNQVWIGGGMFFGTNLTLPTFIDDYRTALERYLNMSLSNTDQQVIYAMNTVREKKVVRQNVDLQIHVPRGKVNSWFDLGYSCYRDVD